MIDSLILYLFVPVGVYQQNL